MSYAEKESWAASLAWARAEVSKLARNMRNDGGHKRFEANTAAGDRERHKAVDAEASLLYQRADALDELARERPKTSRRQLLRLAELLSLLARQVGLEPDLEHGSWPAAKAPKAGEPLAWGEGEGSAFTRLLRDHGIDLVTESAARQRGHALLKGAKPVAMRYFGSPIRITAGVYVLHVQTRAVELKAEEARA